MLDGRRRRGRRGDRYGSETAPRAGGSPWRGRRRGAGESDCTRDAPGRQGWQGADPQDLVWRREPNRG